MSPLINKNNFKRAARNGKETWAKVGTLWDRVIDVRVVKGISWVKFQESGNWWMTVEVKYIDISDKRIP